LFEPDLASKQPKMALKRLTPKNFYSQSKLSLVCAAFFSMGKKLERKKERMTF
jgi:hypothetical protein